MARFNYTSVLFLIRESLSSDCNCIRLLMEDDVLSVKFDTDDAVKLDKAFLVLHALELCDVITLKNRIEFNGHVQIIYYVC